MAELPSAKRVRRDPAAAAGTTAAPSTAAAAADGGEHSSPTPARQALFVAGDQGRKKEEKPHATRASRTTRKRWRTSQQAEDYVNAVGRLMYPPVTAQPFGFNAQQGRFPLERPNTLGILMSPLRRPSVIERWSPFEVACFEAAISLHGKLFHLIQRIVRTKTTKEVIEFYYLWKKTSHYEAWKQVFEPTVTFVEESDEEELGPDGEEGHNGLAALPGRVNGAAAEIQPKTKTETAGQAAAQERDQVSKPASSGHGKGHNGRHIK